MSAPHVIIGSGINALVAAALLSRKGEPVLMLERSEHLGGCMRTEEVTLPGFHHDVMAATFVLFLTSPAYGELAEDLGRHGLEFCHTAKPTAVLRPDGQAAVLTMDRAANVAAFDGLEAGDGKQHEKDVSGIEADAEFLFALLGSPLWSGKMARLMAKQAWNRGLNGLKTWFGEALQPARPWLEHGYGSETVQALWAPWVLHTGLTPESTYSGQMGRVIAFALEAAGAPVAKGGSGSVPEVFRKLIEEKGGKIRTGVDVARIRVKNGKAVGIETADGETIKAQSVIASVTPTQLHQRLLGDEPVPEHAERYRYGRGNFQLHYALSGEPEWIADGLEDVALIHLTDGIDSVSKSSNEAERGLLPETPTICVGQPHRLDPSRAPEGSGILWLQIPDAPRVIKGDAAGKLETDPDWSEATREAFADRLEAILQRHIRNFDQIKLARKAYSPADLGSMNINLVGGDPYGGACSIDQFFVWRPFTHSVNSATTIANLHMIGASTHPGPGLGGGSGYNLAKRMGA
ncbi:NAD(P)/FAD-dependent oxidoreductase [uncultured Roseibium sp.]|uniref:phytoene desaturase family protein n=1 Tax=uncultured Roseibium sp. TaxID=1936171 RepID=UPI0026376D54|nr:NAD(P)/FAD-dependent oxidoreductase [uncultured Roseibium sp.]